MARALTDAERVKTLRRAESMVDASIRNITRAVTSLKFWRRRVAYYRRETALSADERAQRIEEQRARVLQRRRSVRRIAT